MSVPRNFAPRQQSSRCAGSQETVGMRTNSRSARSISREMRAETCERRHPLFAVCTKDFVEENIQTENTTNTLYLVEL